VSEANDLNQLLGGISYLPCISTSVLAETDCFEFVGSISLSNAKIAKGIVYGAFGDDSFAKQLPF